MKHHHLVKGQRIVMGEREYVVEKRLSNGGLQLKDAAVNTYVTRSDDEIVDLLFKGDLKLLGDEHAEAYAQKKMAGLLEADLTEFSEPLREEARRKYEYITNIMEMGADRKTRKVFEPLIQTIARALDDKTPPSYWQVYRWYTDFVAAGESPRAFFPRVSQKGNGKRKVQREVSEIIDEAIAAGFLNEQRLTVLAVYDAVVVRIQKENELRAMAGNIEKLVCPNERAVYRIVDKLDPYEVAKARYGQRCADLKFKPKKEGARPTRPLQRVEVDHTKLDLLVVDQERRMPIGRPWLTLAIDVYSKCIVGIYIGFVPPSYHSVMQCLKHAMSPKTYIRERFPSIKHTWDAYGIMETVVVDNGKEFHSKDFEDACLQLGIVIQYAPVRASWYKPSVERFFGTLNTNLLHQQPGTTFSNIFEKDEYDSNKNAVISYETFEEMVHKWIADIYHQDKHKGIMSIPAVVWQTGVQEFTPALPSNAAELEIMLGMIDTRTITDSGIELHNLIYNDDKLMSIRRRYKLGTKTKVKVKYDPSDLSIIWVQDTFRKTYSPVRAISQSYTQGLNLWAHRVICRYAREQLKLDLDIASLALAKEEIWRMASAEWNLTKRTGSRQKIARLFNIGQDDYGEVIEQEPGQDTATPELIPEQLRLADDPVQPLPADHPANGISCIGTAVNSAVEGAVEKSGDGTLTETDSPVTGKDIGKGEFVTAQPKKKGRPKRKKTIGGDDGPEAANQGSPTTTIAPQTEEMPDLSEWGISYESLN